MSNCDEASLKVKRATFIKLLADEDLMPVLHCVRVDSLQHFTTPVAATRSCTAQPGDLCQVPSTTNLN